MLVSEDTYVMSMVGAIGAIGGGAVALAMIIRAMPAQRRRMPSLMDPVEPAGQVRARRGTGPVARGLAATFVVAGLIAAAWLFFSNGRVLVAEDGDGRGVVARWMRQLGDASYTARGTTIELERPGEGVLVVNGSSHALEVKSSGSNLYLDGPGRRWMVAPGEATTVPRVDYVGPGGPRDLIEFLHGGPGPTRYWVDWSE
jgi:hypothetical protein